MRKRLFLLSFVLFLFQQLGAQQLRPAGSPSIYHKLERLNRLTKVLYFAAHPDDENTRLLAWLVNDQNVETAYLSLTRGDGGQNILGKEQGAALGLIRTYELLEARKIDGAQQFFTRAIDFGFSKSPDETFRHWNADSLTSDAVWIMRTFKPDVVICRFPPDSRAGHGQHSASAIIAARAFKEAGDPKKYSGQLKYTDVWQPARLLFNTFRFGSVNTTSGSQFQLSTGQYNPETGMGYGELAGISRSVHKSQGAGTPNVPGIQTEYFELTDGRSLSSSLFDGVDITWNRVGRKDISEKISSILKLFSFENPAASIPELLKLRKEIQSVKDSYWRNEKLRDLDDIILDCTGLMVEAVSRNPEAVAGNTLPFTLNIIIRAGMPAFLKSIAWPGAIESRNVALPDDSLVTFEKTVVIPRNTPLSEPYWLTKPGMDQAHYYVSSGAIRGLPVAPASLNCTLELAIGDQNFNISVPLSYKKLDPVRGDMVEALRVVPSVTTGFTQPVIIRDTDGSLKAEIRMHAFEDTGEGTLTASTGIYKKRIAGIRLKAGADTAITITVPGQELREKQGPFFLQAAFESAGVSYNLNRQVISYGHIPTLQYFTPASVKVLPQTWKCTAKKIGYIEGAGDYTAGFLRLAGLQVDVLQDADFTSAEKLKQYDAIVTGVRAVNTEKRMRYWLPVLLRYVQDGGTLVMQYNTLQDLSTTNIGPYPFTLSNLRVTEEDAPVTFVNPQHRLLNYPNKITMDDFSGWVQERGLNFPSSWDNHYESLFIMNDTGESPLKGSTLYTHYGKGHYIYTPLSFFRQLPAGNAGAVRLFMNMISAGR